jgi:NifU-like protein
MWEYSDTVKEHFFNPRNAGAVDDANGTGEVGSISCGDALRLTLKVDPDTDVILDAGFQTFGCGSAIASSSALTEMIKGMKVDDALKVTNQDIADFLGGLPAEKMHCSVMGREALEAAVANYRGEEWVDDHEEGELVCKCFGIEAPMIEQQVRQNRLTAVEDVTNFTKAGGGCSTCHEKIEEIIAKTWEAMGEPMPAAVAKPEPDEDLVPLVSPEPIAASGKLTMVQRIRKIEEVLESLRPTLQADNGDVELIDVDGNTVYVKMTGACSGCQMAAMTLGGIQQKLMEALGEFIKVVPESEMAKRAAQG